jgi:hypothetical protein
MSDVTALNPFKQEDEGYLAAEAGLRLADNPHPQGTIRHEEWRRGWQMKRDETKHEHEEGYDETDASMNLSDNPHPPGTIRYAQWRKHWQIKREKAMRALRLGQADKANAGSERT